MLANRGDNHGPAIENRTNHMLSPGTTNLEIVHPYVYSISPSDLHNSAASLNLNVNTPNTNLLLSGTKSFYSVREKGSIDSKHTLSIKTVSTTRGYEKHPLSLIFWICTHVWHVSFGVPKNICSLSCCRHLHAKKPYYEMESKYKR